MKSDTYASLTSLSLQNCLSYSTTTFNDTFWAVNTSRLAVSGIKLACA